VAVHKIRKYGTGVLREKTAPVAVFDSRVEKLLRNLEDTLRASGGMGLSAPQIGARHRVFVAFDEGRKRLFRVVNPQILEVAGEELEMEGCLSFPEVFFSIKRPARVVMSCMSPKGRKTVLEATGMLARCFLHEIDHLEGKLIIDYATPHERKFWKEKLEGMSRKSSP
jgi:peptide deformylase